MVDGNADAAAADPYTDARDCRAIDSCSSTANLTAGCADLLAQHTCAGNARSATGSRLAFAMWICGTGRAPGGGAAGLASARCQATGDGDVKATRRSAASGRSETRPDVPGRELVPVCTPRCALTAVAWSGPRCLRRSRPERPSSCAGRMNGQEDQRPSNTRRAMTIRCTSLVPSPMVIRRASRYMRSTGYSCE